MKINYYIYLLLFILFVSRQPLSGECCDTEHGERESILIRQYINSKRIIYFEEKECDLRISGDIRAQWQSRIERLNGENLRKRRGTSDIPSCASSNAVVNLRIDHKKKDSWAHAHIAFDNSMGNEGIGDKKASDVLNKGGLWGSGICHEIALKRAYWGMNIWKGSESCAKDLPAFFKDTTFAIEVGRRPLYTIFDSRIEFHARFDGVLFKFSKELTKTSQIYFNWGPFLVDMPGSHFAYACELGYLDILESRLDAKYSFIDWNSLLLNNGRNRCNTLNPRAWQFKVSQLALAYNVRDDIFGRKTRIYGAFLINTDAKRRAETHFRRLNLGWYLGFVIGEVKKRGDWSINSNYQYVQAQAIPDVDAHGIGLGGVKKETFIYGARGKTNYRGWQLQMLYGLTDKLSLDATFDIAKSLDSKLMDERGIIEKSKIEKRRKQPIVTLEDIVQRFKDGVNEKKLASGRRFYSKFEVSLILAF